MSADDPKADENSRKEPVPGDGPEKKGGDKNGDAKNVPAGP